MRVKCIAVGELNHIRGTKACIVVCDEEQFAHGHHRDAAHWYVRTVEYMADTSGLCVTDEIEEGSVFERLNVAINWDEMPIVGIVTPATPATDNILDTVDEQLCFVAWGPESG